MKTQDLIDGFERLFFTKYDKLENHERMFVQGYFRFLRRTMEGVLALGLVTLPLMVVCVAEWHWQHFLVALWSLSEIAFYVNHHRMLPKLKVRRELKASYETRAGFAKGLLANIGDPAASKHEQLANWVVGDEELNEGHLVQWILLLMYGKSAAQMSDADLPHAREIITAFRTSFKLPPPDETRSSKVYGPGIDVVDSVHKPLLFFQVPLTRTR